MLEYCTSSVGNKINATNYPLNFDPQWQQRDPWDPAQALTADDVISIPGILTADCLSNGTVSKQVKQRKLITN